MELLQAAERYIFSSISFTGLWREQGKQELALGENGCLIEKQSFDCTAVGMLRLGAEVLKELRKGAIYLKILPQTCS